MNVCVYSQVNVCAYVCGCVVEHVCVGVGGKVTCVDLSSRLCKVECSLAMLSKQKIRLNLIFHF